MTDFVQLQNDIFYALMSRKELGTVNVKQFRKMVIQSEIDMKLVYLTARGGKVGAGILVEMPTLSVDKPNVQGPILEVDFSVLVMEQPTINMSATSGTTIAAEEIAVMVQETLHHLSLGTGALRALPNAIVPATEYPGVVAYRCHAGFTSGTPATPRVNVLTATLSGGNVTVNSTIDTTAEIRYTLDGSYPASVDAGNVNSQIYAGPVAVTSGQTFRAAAYLAGKIGSSVAVINVP